MWRFILQYFHIIIKNTVFRISGSTGKKSTFTFLRLETLKSWTAHTVHFKSWYFLHPLSSLHYTYFYWLCFHPRNAVYARRSVVGLHPRINTSVWWQSEVGRRGVPAVEPRVIENVPASNQVPSCQHCISTLLIFCVRTVFLPIFTHGHVSGEM